MSLQDKLNENRSMSELFQETRELNELMKSYIRVHMNEEMAKEVTIHNQLNQIQSKSDEVMRNMQSILNEQEKMLKENTEVLQKILIDGHEEIQRNNNRTIQALGELQKTNNAQLEEMNEEIKSSVRNMQNNLNSVVKKARQETMDLVSSAKHGALVTNIIDALKYGAATSVITVPILYLLLS
uniref:Mobilization protein B n=1 Tax=Staphylococcus aureus TaxID=1280 RepID=K0JCQ3_STAAU|nr:mobilization protein B [Staphylococcus aureus]